MHADTLLKIKKKNISTAIEQKHAKKSNIGCEVLMVRVASLCTSYLIKNRVFMI
jgi:hypothetical protein